LPRISPDGSKVSLLRWDRNSQKYDIWILQTLTKQLTRFTVDRSVDDIGTWSPDQSELAFTSSRTLVIKTLNGIAADKNLIQENQDLHPISWSPDGKLIFFHRQNIRGDADIYVVSPSGTEKPRTIIATTSDEQMPRISPDGKWLAYKSNATGQYEIYVCPFPGCNRQWKISNGGADVEFWKRDGSELYYQFQNRLMATHLKITANEFQFDSPRLLFTVPRNTSVDISPDGRFLAAEPVLNSNQNFLGLLIHWPSTLK